MEMMSAGAEPSVLTVTMAWTTVLAMGCTVALVIAQNLYLHRPWLDSRTGLLSFGGGFVFGVVSGYLAQIFFSLAVAAGQGNPLFVEMSRVMAWVIFGGFVGLGMSFVIPNLGNDRGAVAVCGGVGAVGFIFGGAIADDVAVRAIGLSKLGLTLGVRHRPHGRSRRTCRAALRCGTATATCVSVPSPGGTPCICRWPRAFPTKRPSTTTTSATTYDARSTDSR